MRVLFISPYIPTPIRTRSFNFIRALARRGHQITLLALQPSGDPGSLPDEIVRACQRCEVLPLSRARVFWNLLWTLPRDFPLQAAYSRSPQMARLIRESIAGADGRPSYPIAVGRRSPYYDVVHIEHLRGAVLGTAVEGVPKVYDAVDCISLLFERALHQAPSWRHRLMARIDLARTRRFEGHIIGQMDGVLVSSPEDRDALVKLSGSEFADRLNVVPNGVDLDYFRPVGGPEAPATNGVVFSGKMSYHANIAAALDLAEKVMPWVWRTSPDVRLTIAGKDPPVAVTALQRDPRIRVTGTVADLRPILANAAVVACALRYGAGIQNKVLEAMAMGRPVVASRQAATALRATPGSDLLLGHDAEDFAQHILRLIADPGLRASIGQAGRRYVEAHHAWDDVAGQLEQVYRRVSR
jgi:glycosyltransferase involved in cell wall biosynthesis